MLLKELITTSRVAAIVFGTALNFSGAGSQANAATAPLLTQSQYQIDRLALSLRDHPAVIAARQKVLTSWSALPQAQLPDGKATLASAVDELVFLALRSAATDPSRPQVIWTEAPAYETGGLQVPSGRNGDSPDRIYRFAALDPRYKYVIHGHRNAQPSLAEFSFEAIKPPAAVAGDALSHLSSSDIDIASDGSFTVTADSTPVNGRRNHLYLPPATSSILIRDTLVDWGSQLPNELSIERVDGGDAVPRDHAALAKVAAQEIVGIADFNLPFLQLISKTTPNKIMPRIRPLAWGLPGSGIALSCFSFKKGEALAVTLDPLGGRYLGFVLGDPWLRSVTYWNRTGSLNNHQAKANPDGTITYVIAAQDPGVYNWLETNGLQDGTITIRWEGLPKSADIQKGVKSVQIVPLSNLASVLPHAPRVEVSERRQLLAQRQAAYAQRTRID